MRLLLFGGQYEYFPFYCKSHANFTVFHTYAQYILNFALRQKKIRSHADVPKGSNKSDHPQMTQLRLYLHLNKPAYKTLFQQYNDPIYSYMLIRTMHNEVLRRARNTQCPTTDNITFIRIGNALVYDLCFLTWFQLLYKITFQTSPTKI